MNNKESDYLSDSGEHHRSSVQLSKHVKKKIQDHRHRHQRSTSVTSDDVFLDDDQESTVLSGRSSSTRKRENTFTTYLIQRPTVESATLKLLPLRKNLKEEEVICQKCVRYEDLLRERNQRLINFEEKNRKINGELRSMTLKNRQFQEENFYLKRRLQRLTLYLRQYEEKLDVFKGKKPIQTISQSDVDHLRRLRHEVQSYSQAIAARQQQEERRFSHLYRSQYR